MIIVNLRAQLVSAKSVTILVVAGSSDIYDLLSKSHPSADVRNAAGFSVSKMTGKLQGKPLPPNWPTTPLALPIANYKQNALGRKA